MESTADTTELDRHPTGTEPLPEFVDWTLGALLAIAGFISLVGGTALAFLVDREFLATGVEEGTITVDLVVTELTREQQLELVATLISWTGIGMLVTGVGMVAVAIWYVLRRHQAHSRARSGETVSSYSTYALLGGLATVVLSFIPFSPVAGGAIAGYLERGESERTVSVGALAGLIPSLPIVVLLVFVTGGLLSGATAVGEGGLAMVLATAMVLGMLLIVAFAAGLGALGGYAGGWFAESRAASTASQGE